VYNSITFGTLLIPYPLNCLCEERSKFALPVIASLNALAFRRGNLVFATTSVIASPPKAGVAISYFQKKDWETNHLKNRLPRLPFGKPRNDRGEDCHCFSYRKPRIISLYNSVSTRCILKSISPKFRFLKSPFQIRSLPFPFRRKLITRPTITSMQSAMTSQRRAITTR
jgi:hypothetical protein